VPLFSNSLLSGVLGALRSIAHTRRLDWGLILLLLRRWVRGLPTQREHDEVPTID
jgi:hypothetical protein